MDGVRRADTRRDARRPEYLLRSICGGDAARGKARQGVLPGVFEKFGTAEVEKGYQTLFENVFKPFFRRLGIESEHCMEYHFEFVKAGYFAVTRKWLLYGCPETPEEMAKIIKRSMAAIPDDLLPVPDELFI